VLGQNKPGGAGTGDGHGESRPSPTRRWRRRSAPAPIFHLIIGSAVALILAACTASPAPKPRPEEIADHDGASPPPPSASPAPPSPRSAGQTTPPPRVFEAEDFIVALAAPGDTAESLATQHLGRSDLAWMIEDYMDARSFSANEQVVIPKRDWNPPGVLPSGYQVVPVLVYQNVSPTARGDLVVSPDAFTAQMRYLRQEGYRVVAFEHYLAFLQQNRQLPKKSVVLTFDDAYRGFLQHAYPVLTELGFPAALFVSTDQIGTRPEAPFLSWAELRDLALAGIPVQAHSKSHRDLRRASGEGESAYARRMQQELAQPLEQLKARMPRTGEALEAIAYPAGQWDDELLAYVKKWYAVGFTSQPESSPAFAPLLAVSRIPVRGDWTLDDFKRALQVFHAQRILPDGPEDKQPESPVAPAPRDQSRRQKLAAPHRLRADELEARGFLHQALLERRIAIAIDPGDGLAKEKQESLEARIATEVAARIGQGLKLAPTSPQEGRRQLLSALALDPFSRPAFDGLRGTPARFLTHSVRRDETAASLADLYYGDRSKADIIERENGLAPGAPLPVGSSLTIPEIPGRPFLRPDR